MQECDNCEPKTLVLSVPGELNGSENQRRRVGADGSKSVAQTIGEGMGRGNLMKPWKVQSPLWTAAAVMGGGAEVDFLGGGFV